MHKGYPAFPKVLIVLLQVPRISAAFGVQPPVYLIKEFDQTVIFPSEGSGKFNPSAFVTGATYEVQGITHGSTHGTQGSANPSSMFSSQAASPYGTYQVPRCPQPSCNPMPHPPAPHARRRIIQKTVLLAKVAARDANKPSSSRASRLSHTIITSIVVKLDHGMGECNVETVAEMVKAQVGFDVILLDCKLYPLIANDSTSGLDYWKSTRKVIATSRAVYEKLVGKSAVDEISTVDDEVAIIEPPAKKARVASDDVETTPILDKLAEIEKGVSSVNHKLTFIDDFKKSFECIICRLPCKLPVVNSCCQRIVGCRDCVRRWRESNPRCPLKFCLEGYRPIDWPISCRGGTRDYTGDYHRCRHGHDF